MDKNPTFAAQIDKSNRAYEEIKPNIPNIDRLRQYDSSYAYGVSVWAWTVKRQTHTTHVYKVHALYAFRISGAYIIVPNKVW